MIKVYMKTRNGANAEGIYDEINKELTVIKGSKVSSTVSSSQSFRGRDSIIKSRAENCDRKGFVKQDVVFKSSSTAANFVNGNSSNGFRTWKTESGQMLKDYLADNVN